MPFLSDEFSLFLGELKENNNREWFKANKKRFDTHVKEPFNNLVQDLLLRLTEVDPTINPSVKESVFRIYRDTRFSNNKTPYKVHMGAVLSPNGRKAINVPGYYIQLEADKISVFGGCYSLEPKQLLVFRENLSEDNTAFREAISEEVFVEKFGEIMGEKNKVIPKQFKEAALKEPCLYNKQLYYTAVIDKKYLTSENLTDILFEYYLAGKNVTDELRKLLNIT